VGVVFRRQYSDGSIQIAVFRKQIFVFETYRLL
jgi:hypothetical protein